ncbi:unnamed protein product, partial [Durusdinium trenchii]
GHAQPIHGAVVHGDVGDGGDGHEQRSHMANTEDQQGEARAEPEEKELAAPPARHAAQEDLQAPDDLPAPAPAPSSAEAVEVPAEEPVAEPVLQVEGPPEELPGDGEALARPEPERALVIQLPGSSNHLH